MTLRAKIALPLATIHLILVLLCFGGTFYRLELPGLDPFFVFQADMPASYAFELLSDWIHSYSDSYTSLFLIDAAVYGVLGTAWWLFIGLILAWLLSAASRDYDSR